MARDRLPDVLDPLHQGIEISSGHAYSACGTWGDVAANCDVWYLTSRRMMLCGRRLGEELFESVTKTSKRRVDVDEIITSARNAVA